MPPNHYPKYLNRMVRTTRYLFSFCEFIYASNGLSKNFRTKYTKELLKHFYVTKFI